MVFFDPTKTTELQSYCLNIPRLIQQGVTSTSQANTGYPSRLLKCLVKNEYGNNKEIYKKDKSEDIFDYR